jgi:hypothetical protein
MTQTNTVKRKAKSVSTTTTPNMKHKLQFKALAAAFLMVVLFAIAGSAQTDRVPIPMLGGYSSTNTDNPDVVEAAEFAILTKNKTKGARFELIEILTAQSQAVAGTNYKLCIEANVTNNKDDEADTKQFLVVVFSDLKNKLSLTSWLERKCSK